MQSNTFKADTFAFLLRLSHCGLHTGAFRQPSSVFGAYSLLAP